MKSQTSLVCFLCLLPAALYSQQYAPDPQLGYGQPAYPQPQPYQQQVDPNQQFAVQGYAPQQAPAQALNTEQLEQLVAPIALYPDTLVAQVLAAATYPDQVVDADHWRQAQGYAPADQIAAGADSQTWDPSLKALTAFPEVLAEMDQNLRWTIALGNAYYNQPQDVLDVVQVMRQRAQTAGNLQSTPQESMSYDQGYIQLAPVNPQIVYVPVYDPWTAYGQPIQPYRGFSLFGALGSFFGSSIGSGAIRYGLGIAMSAFSHTSFGWLGWGLNWLTHSVLFQNSNYSTRSTSVADWGLPHGGPRAPMQRGAVTSRLPNHSYRPQFPGNSFRPSSELRSPNAYTGYNRPPVSGFVRPSDGYSNSRPYQGAIRSYTAPASASARPPMESYNRIPPQFARPQGVARPQELARNQSGYGYGYQPYRAAGSYAARPNPAFAQSQQAYRAPASGFQQGEYGTRSGQIPGGRGLESYSGKAEKSGGFHLFGGGHEHQPKAPKPFKEPSHGHSDHGGHSGGLFGGKRHR